MSASAKKKLRKEENAALLTEKQRRERKEARSLKIYTWIFVAAIVVILVATLAIVGTNYYRNSGIVEKHTVAAVIDDYEFNSVEMSYYYTDLLNSSLTSWKNTYGDSMQFYLSLMGLDITQPLNAQSYTENTTWADYFVESAVEQAKSDYLLCKQAEAEGFTLSAETRAELDASINNLTLYASIYGYADVDAYLRAMYGPGSNMESYSAYAEKTALATEYYNDHSENLQIDDAAIREYEADKFDEYSSFSYANYAINYSDFLTGGTEDENGTVTYSDEEKDAARAAAKAAADSLPTCSTVEELQAAIVDLTGSEDAASDCTVVTDALYSTIGSDYRQWLADSSRKDGDFFVMPIESTITNDDGEEITIVNSSWVVMTTTRPLPMSVIFW